MDSETLSEITRLRKQKRFADAQDSHRRTRTATTLPTKVSRIATKLQTSQSLGCGILSLVQYEP